MELHNIERSSWIKAKAKRRWRWNGSWRWNYSTKWLKGQKARTWHSLHPGFEWGQTPLFQRLPKNRWFKRYFKLKKDVRPINVSVLDLHQSIGDKEHITIDLLLSLWLVSKWQQVKILWTWDISKKLTFSDDFLFSSSAREKLGMDKKNTKKTKGDGESNDEKNTANS